MKTFRYMLFGSPHNFDDCIHYSKKHKPKSISVELDTLEFTTELVFKHLVVKYTWDFWDKQVEHSEFYDMFFASDLNKSQKAVVDSVNGVLERDLETIAKTGATLEGAQQRFDYSVTY